MHMETNAQLLEQIYQTYADRVRNYLAGKLRDTNTADEICSEVFAKIVEKIDTYDPAKAALSTWVFTIANNKLTDFYRKNARRGITEEIPESFQSSDDLETEICREETLRELAHALKQLDEREQDVIIQHYYHGRPLKEVAISLHISYSYAKVLHRNALSHLQEVLVL